MLRRAIATLGLTETKGKALEPLACLNLEDCHRKVRKLLDDAFQGKKPGVRIGQSEMKGAGRGIFAENNIMENEPICFYPGWYAPPQPAALMMNEDGSLKENCTFLRERDNPYLMYLPHVGGFIDAKEWETEDANFAGHLLNHPPKGVLPNAWTVEFLWQEVEEKLLVEEEIRRYLPNAITQMPWFVDDLGVKYCDQGSMRLAGVLILAFRDIQRGEEIFIDYALNDGEKIFDWYHSVEYPAPRKPSSVW